MPNAERVHSVRFRFHSEHLVSVVRQTPFSHKNGDREKIVYEYHEEKKLYKNLQTLKNLFISKSFSFNSLSSGFEIDFNID